MADICLVNGLQTTTPVSPFLIINTSYSLMYCSKGELCTLISAVHPTNTLFGGSFPVGIKECVSFFLCIGILSWEGKHVPSINSLSRAALKPIGPIAIDPNWAQRLRGPGLELSTLGYTSTHNTLKVLQRTIGPSTS